MGSRAQKAKNYKLLLEFGPNAGVNIQTPEERRLGRYGSLNKMFSNASNKSQATNTLKKV